MATDMHKQLTKYLTDAHSIEEQALRQLRSAPDIAGDQEFALALRQHLSQTENHERRIRTLLEARGASPSRVKDAALRAAGSGFVLFARSQTDTPGKLAAHTLSFEALEYASYELLARTAEQAGEPEVAEAAREIQRDERAMMDRTEGLFDATVDASLAAKDSKDLSEDIRKYLADAHAIEAQSIKLLDSGAAKVGAATLSQIFRDHLVETYQQQRLIEERLEALGGDPSWLKDAAMKIGALDWSLFFSAHPDTPAKLVVFAYAFEHLEIGGYEQLRRVAQRAGDGETANLAGRILTQERAAAEKLSSAFDVALSSGLMDQAAD